jgi:hypothetical protein
MYEIDGFDLWDNFGITIEKGGLDDFLKIPARKQSIQHDWTDEDGIDIDLSRTFLEAREISIPCVIIAESETDFWTKYNGFLGLLIKPNTRRFTVNPLSSEFMVFYKDCTIYQKLTAFKQTGKLICKFTLAVVEKAPSVAGNQAVYIIDEQGRFLIA